MLPDQGVQAGEGLGTAVDNDVLKILWIGLQPTHELSLRGGHCSRAIKQLPA